ncbi:RSP_7527 family protein [Falsigemmobacter faecalis]|uniref:Uncharacterized protein n=1 Tax=Falsigemmobacter faecalis TaxID=2488730 RepID=A0A3P3DMC1_9RHOB|nr:hypothetical protein [Falsigemmobacter faecalis]RRH74752.1 hypothetical protein EG244_09625 [Falsigemmobacter faecalis]
MSKSFTPAAPLTPQELNTILREARAHRARVLAKGVSAIAQRLRALFGAGSRTAGKGQNRAV